MARYKITWNDAAKEPETVEASRYEDVDKTWIDFKLRVGTAGTRQVLRVPAKDVARIELVPEN